MILVVDNYDSFVYNLVQQVGTIAESVQVRRNDAIDADEIDALDPDGVVLSPGPGRPEDAGVTSDPRQFDCPVLGVCLGHQALVDAAGGTVTTAPEIVHGKRSDISHDGRGLFADLPSPMTVGRYHSLAVDDVPGAFEISAETDAGLVMAVRHTDRPHVGVQFHPESILTPHGDALVEAFVRRCER
ncbi:anthranilate synthase component II [Halococcoides cellulosivorans]|uniref:Anthranilate synthase component II n=1 Tax=Halococcoides cellulosivorans TaxID=1679096 RepID=A0A2R4WZA0_9EURY|nr:aminodeoxychorismate/anthranilate synthase component II [Halococcoides cellulosivorans]AWB26870.1 anthranilate/aminodeoxychorismate synthase component II [Halococcoides cellulosivorans]